MNKVIMYTTKTCPFCKMQKDFFTQNNVQYQEILVDENPDEAQKMIEISGQMGVPFTVVEKDDGQKESVLGFDENKLKSMLGLNT